MCRIGAGRGVVCHRGVSDGSDGVRPLRRSHSARTEMSFADGYDVTQSLRFILAVICTGSIALRHDTI